jgi:hypothetical protein
MDKDQGLHRAATGICSRILVTRAGILRSRQNRGVILVI